jgi:hypothetical protein
MIRRPDFQANLSRRTMSDADDQTGGSADPRFDKPAASEPKEKPADEKSKGDETS